MGKASITIAVNAKWNGQQLNNAEKALQRLTTLTAASSKSTQSELAKQGSAWAELGGKIYNMGTQTEKVGKMLSKSVTAPIIAVGTYAGKMAVDYDTAMANVRKTTNASDSEIQKLADSALKLSTTQPVTAEQLLNIEALGAQLGVSNGKLESFAKTVSGLDIATDLNAEQAATEMAQFANITQMSQDQFSNFGSTVVDLGNHLATTESKITDMAMRLAGAGTAANLSQADILGIAGAMASLGIRSEAGGSAMTRIIQDISKNVANGAAVVQEYARVSGMSAEEFSNKWKTKPMEAIEDLVTGLKRTHDSGEDMNVTLEKMGIKNIRNSDAMRRLANAGDLLKNSVDRANNAWQQNTALQTEVDQRNRSMASRLQVLKNKVDAVAITIGVPLVNAVISALDATEPLIQGIGNLADAFSKMDTGQQQFVLAMVGIAAAAGPVLTMFGKLEQGVGKVVTAFGKGQQNFAVWKDALDTTDGAQMRTYASADTLASKLGIAGNKAAQAAGDTQTYVKAWEGYYSTSKQVVDLESKYSAAVEKSKAAVENAKSANERYSEAVKQVASTSGEANVAAQLRADKLKAQAEAANKAKDAAVQNRQALLNEISTTQQANSVYGNMIDKWSGSTKETSKVSAEIAASSKKASSSVLDTAKAFEKQANSAKSSDGVLKSLGSGIKNVASGLAGMAGSFLANIGPQLAFAAAIAGIGAVIGDFVQRSEEARQHAETMSKAMQTGDSIMANASSSAANLGDAIGDISVDADSTTQKLIELNESVGQTFTDVETNSAKLDQYVATINELANKSNLSSTEQWRLAEAVKGYNEVTGSAYQLTDAVNGKIADGNGEIQENTDQLNKNAEAWKKNAEAKALSNAASKYMQQEIETQGKLTLATDAYHDAKAKEQKIRDKVNSMSERCSSLTSKEKEELAKLSGELIDATSKTGDYKKKMDELSDDYKSAAEKSAYFGTKAAAAHAGLDEAAQNSAAKMASSMATMSNKVTSALDKAGINITDLAVKMQQAGVSSEQLNSISSGNFASMVANCGGNMDTLIAMIQNYNNTPVVNKDGTVQVDSSTLLFANGQVVEWNNGQLVYKSSGATVDYGTVVDATGAEYTYNEQGLQSKSASDKVDSSQTKDGTKSKKDYNGTPLNGKNSKDKVDSSSVKAGKKAKEEYNKTPLNGKSATDTVHYGSVTNANSALKTYQNLSISNKSATVTITTNHVDNYIKTHRNDAAGGIIRHAMGGVRYHAHGNIVNNPGPGVPLDIVGEAGAEAIVPLTNRKYSRPFARTIAEQMKQLPGGTSSPVNNYYTLNIDGAAMRGNDRARELIEALVGELVQ